MITVVGLAYYSHRVGDFNTNINFSQFWGTEIKQSSCQ